MEEITLDHSEEPVRIWTDYERLNQGSLDVPRPLLFVSVRPTGTVPGPSPVTSGLNMTYFWSKTANHWLNTLDQFDPFLKDDDDYIQNLKWNFKSSVTFDGYR